MEFFYSSSNSPTFLIAILYLVSLDANLTFCPFLPIAKEEFSSSMLKLHNYDDTKKRIDFFINKFSKSLNKELNNIGITFKNWYKEIINSYSKNTYGVVLTNAMAESNNNYIQTLINIGYGYTNFKRLRKRILYMSSNKNRNQN